MNAAPEDADVLEAALPRDTANDSARMVHIRWALGILVILTTIFCDRILLLPLPAVPLYLTGLFILGYNAPLAVLGGRAQDSNPACYLKRVQRLLTIQIVLDWISLGLLLHFSGGISSPAIPFLFIHMLTVVILLPAHPPFLYVAVGVGILTIIAGLEGLGVLPHYRVIPALPAAIHVDLAYVGGQILFFALAATAMVYLTAKIMRRLRERERQLDALFRTTQAVSSSLDLPEVLQAVATSAAHALGMTRASVRLLDESGDNLTMSASCGLTRAYLEKGPVDLARSPLDRQAMSGEPVIVSDAATDPRIQYPREAAAEGLRGILVVPINGRNRTLGVLRVYADRPEAFAPADAVFAALLARQGGTAIENAIAHEALRRAEQVRAEFVRTVTHELRAPLSAGQSLLRTLLRGLSGELSPAQRDILNRVNGRLDALMDLVSDLLDLAMSETLKHERPLICVDLNHVLEAAVDDMTLHAEEKGIALQLNIACSAEILATEEGLRRIIDNLLSNAIKYTLPGGSVKLLLELDKDDNDEIILTVEDTGIGIPETDIPHLGQQFYRGRNAKQAGIGGTGLGLTITRNLVESFKGSIGIHSAEGRGTTVQVRLPLAQDRTASSRPA